MTRVRPEQSPVSQVCVGNYRGMRGMREVRVSACAQLHFGAHSDNSQVSEPICKSWQF